MRLALHNLVANHPKLLGHPTDYARFGALALQRALHSSPVKVGVEHEGSGGFAYAVFRNTSTNEVVVAFRGSDNAIDWLGNAGFKFALESGNSDHIKII